MKHTDDQDGRSDALMDCEQALELVPTFVDGEASESLASAMRKHLLDCHDCRSVVQEETGLRQWFEPLAGEAGRADVEVPAGFAARVTELAFAAGSAAGNPAGSSAGNSAGAVHTHAHRAGSNEGQARRGPRALVPSGRADSPETRKESAPLGFLVGMTAMAAALLAAFTLMLAQDNRLDVGERPLAADVSLEEGLRKIEAENAAEAARIEEANREAAALKAGADADELQETGSEQPSGK